MGSDAQPDETPQDVQVVHAQVREQFEITIDGESVGFAEYVDSLPQRIFHHTVVDDRFRGHGLAGRLVDFALTSTVADGFRIVPVCSYVAEYVQKHREYDDVVDPVTSETFHAI